MIFTKSFTAQPSDIDELGHINNAIWVRWVQDLATAHWATAAPLEHQQAYIWVVARHEIDYRGNLGVGGVAEGATWVSGEPRGALADRHFRFRDDAGRVLVEGVTRWALLDRTSGRPLRVRPAVLAPFVAS